MKKRENNYREKSEETIWDKILGKSSRVCLICEHGQFMQINRDKGQRAMKEYRGDNGNVQRLFFLIRFPFLRKEETITE